MATKPESVSTGRRAPAAAVSYPSPVVLDLEMLRETLTATVSRAMQENRDISQLRSGFLTVDIPAEPVDAARYYLHLAEDVVPYSAPVSSPRCLAHMTSVVPEVLRPIAELVVSLNQNMVKRDASGVLTLIERQTLGALHKLVFDRPADFYTGAVQDDASTLGIITSGGTVSNITALWIARNRALPSRPGFAGVEREGMAAALRHYGYTRAVVLGSSLLHYSIEKAVSVLGLGSDSCIKLPLDSSRRIDVNALREALAQCRVRNELVIALVGVAGATDCGSLDRLSDLARLAREFGVHFHVDAAWGCALLFSRAHAPKLEGLTLADSVTFDAHKQMHLPLATGALLLRDPHAARAIEKRAPYMLQEQSGDLGAHSLEGSRPCSALLMHAALHLIGRRGYERMIDDSIRNAQFMAREIERHDELELLAEPETNIVLFRVVPRCWREAVRRRTLTFWQHEIIGSINHAVQSRLARKSDVSVSRTIVHYAGAEGESIPVTGLRAVLGNPHTTEADISLVLDEHVRLAADLFATLDRHGRPVSGAAP